MRHFLHCSQGELAYKVSYILIIGAKSDIAKCVARTYAEHGYDLYLAARTSHELKEFANDIQIRTQRTVKWLEFDVLDYASHRSFYEGLEEKPLGVLSAVGYLGLHNIAHSQFCEVRKIFDVNYTGVVSILNIVADDFERQRRGFIIGISSVAGDRGRRSNYFYGAAKAALTTYLSGLRSRLCDVNVQVLTVKPGFIATKMTQGMKFPEKLTGQPAQVASEIYQAQQNGKDVLYTQWIWRWIMLAIKSIPEWTFKRMSI